MKWFNKILKLLGAEKGLLDVSSGNVAASLISGAFWLLLASLMSNEEYGEINYYFSITMVAAGLSIMGLNVTVMTYLAKGEEKVKNQANFVVLATSCGIGLLTYLLINHLPVVLLLLGISWFTMIQAANLGRRDYKKFSYTIISQRIILVPLAVLLYFLIGINGVLIGYALSTFVFSYSFFKSLNKSDIRLRNLRPKFKFTMHSFSTTISDRVSLHIDKLLIGPLLGFTILGSYQFGFQFMLFLTLIPISIYQYLLPKEASGKESSKIVVIGLGVAVIFSVTFFLTIPFVIETFFAHFKQSIQAAQIMIFGIIPMTISSVIISKLFARGKSKPPFISSLMRVTSLVILILFLGTSFELIGLAFAILISLTIQCIFLVSISKFVLTNST